MQEVAVLSQQFNNPARENYTVFFFKDGAVQATNTVTLDSPDYVGPSVERIKIRADILGSDGVVGSHGHPRGSTARPSHGDVRSSNILKSKLGERYWGEVIRDYEGNYSFLPSQLIPSKPVDYFLGDEDDRSARSFLKRNTDAQSITQRMVIPDKFHEVGVLPPYASSKMPLPVRGIPESHQSLASFPRRLKTSEYPRTIFDDFPEGFKDPVR